jgi:ABC-type uncharacterized transport system permease subunit
MDWSKILTLAFLVQVLTTSIRLGTPLILAALGETFAERAGVFNLGLEGMMLLGAFTAFSVAFTTKSLWLGIAAGMLAGALLGLIFAFVTVTLRADQVVAGFALLTMASGLAMYFYRVQFTTRLVVASVRRFQPIALPGLADIPYLGQILFKHNVITYGMLLLVPICALILYRTRFGLHVTAVGEYPAAADSVGISVTFIRYACVIAGGMAAGLAGAYFSLADLGSYSDSMIGGRGFIALALVIFGHWNPAFVLVGGLVFGAIDAIQTRLQILGTSVPSQFLLMMPYILTIVVLLVGRRRASPSALTVPYARE